MPEKLTKAQRSRVMAAVRSRNTTPELIVRRLLHRLGHRFRLHRRDLPGTPDVVLARLRVVINVNGCFWHRHACRQGRRPPPVRNAAYWATKRAGNVARDARNRRRLVRMGWRVLTVWECQTRDIDRLTRRIARFLRAVDPAEGRER